MFIIFTPADFKSWFSGMLKYFWNTAGSYFQYNPTRESIHNVYVLFWLIFAELNRCSVLVRETQKKGTFHLQQWQRSHNGANTRFRGPEFVKKKTKHHTVFLPVFLPDLSTFLYRRNLLFFPRLYIISACLKWSKLLSDMVPFKKKKGSKRDLSTRGR